MSVFRPSTLGTARSSTKLRSGTYARISTTSPIRRIGLRRQALRGMTLSPRQCLSTIKSALHTASRNQTMTKPKLAAGFSALMMGVAVAASAVPIDPATGGAVAAATPPPPPAGASVPTATKVTHPVPFNDETKIRQSLVQVALAREPADLIIRGANVLNVFTLMWMPDTDIVVKGKRIAWVGPTGQWK